MTSPPSGSDSARAGFDRLDPRIQRWIWQSGWTELRDVQERAIHAILGGDNDVILAAATASGKTEAAFLPILTRMLQSHSPTLALYVSPLKALINDQWSRLDQLTASLDVPVIRWHGDISASTKKRFVRNPQGCLLITPESLEGILMREGHALDRLFGGLGCIVIDELHAFIDTDRGKQLQCLMQRIEVGLKRRIPRIGLSATLGEMRLAAHFLRPGDGATVDIIESNDSGQEVRVLLKGFTTEHPEEGQLESRDESGVWEAIAIDLYTNLRGANNLIFPNRRDRVELLADLLRRQCEMAGVPNEFWPHHGNLSGDIRSETEHALKSRERPASAIATTTLELGIDIGAVKSVAQIGPAPSVASLRQRLGRSGRKKGDPAILRLYSIEYELGRDSSIFDHIRTELVQSVAQVQLLVKGWFEPPRPQSMRLSTLIQQLLSLVAQYGGITAGQGWTVLCESIFAGLSKAEYGSLLRELGRREILIQDASGLLLHGPVGERIVNHYSFVAAFSSPEEYRITCAGKTLGTLPLSSAAAEVSHLIFSGRRWRVVSVHQTEKQIELEPATDGNVPMFQADTGFRVHDRVRQQMRDILASGQPITFLDASSTRHLAEARLAYKQFQLATMPMVTVGALTQIFTWRGDWVNDTLRLMLRRHGVSTTNQGICLVSNTSTSGGVATLSRVLEDIATEAAPSGEELADFQPLKLLGKWDYLLPEALINRNYAAQCLDVPGAVATAALIAEGLRQS